MQETLLKFSQLAKHTHSHGACLKASQISRTRPFLVRFRRPGRDSWFRKAKDHHVLCAASSGQVEEIDPVTGLIVTGSAIASVAGQSLSTGGLRWAYRQSEVAETEGSPARPELLLLHGIGSSSYCYRNLLGLLGGAGYKAYAADWPGHGGSDKPDAADFDYSREAYGKALASFIQELGVRKPYVLFVHGFILGQYGLLYALEHPDEIEKLVVLNTPVGRKTALRPELAAYKNPIAFLRPKPNKVFDAQNFNAAGSPYAMEYRDAQAFSAPYEEETAASLAVAATMDKVDFAALLEEVDEGCRTWRKPALLAFGAVDPFINMKSVFDFLETKRTSMQLAAVEAKMGHMPQEDYPDAIIRPILKFLEESDQ